MSHKKDKPLPEEALDRFARYLEGSVNRRVERLMKSRILLAPAGLLLTATSRALVAWREQDPMALFSTEVRRPPREDGGKR